MLRLRHYCILPLLSKSGQCHIPGGHESLRCFRSPAGGHWQNVDVLGQNEGRELHYPYLVYLRGSELGGDSNSQRWDFAWYRCVDINGTKRKAGNPVYGTINFLKVLDIILVHAHFIIGFGSIFHASCFNLGNTAAAVQWPVSRRWYAGDSVLSHKPVHDLRPWISDWNSSYYCISCCWFRSFKTDLFLAWLP